MNHKVAAIIPLAAVLAACSQPGQQVVTTASPPRLEFSRMLVHWSQYIDPGYLSFVDEVQPEVVQAGFMAWIFGLSRTCPKLSKA